MSHKTPEQRLAELKATLVRGLHEFGFPTADIAALTEVYVYRGFCISQLKQAKAETGGLIPIVEEFLAELEARQAKKDLHETSAPINRVAPSRATASALSLSATEAARHSASARLAASQRKNNK